MGNYYGIRLKAYKIMEDTIQKIVVEEKKIIDFRKLMYNITKTIPISERIMIKRMETICYFNKQVQFDSDNLIVQPKEQIVDSESLDE